jgi:hypothetical protein
MFMVCEPPRPQVGQAPRFIPDDDYCDPCLPTAPVGSPPPRKSDRPTKPRAQRKRRMDKRAKRPRLTLDESDRLWNHSFAVACCLFWIEFIHKEADAQGMRAASLAAAIRVLQEWNIFPPPADNDPMVPCQCNKCGGVRRWPRHYVGSSGISYECKLERMRTYDVEQIPSSPGIIDMARMRAARRAGRHYEGGM